MGWSFKLKNPRKGTETARSEIEQFWLAFQIKESPEGDWNIWYLAGGGAMTGNFQIKESPEGDWNDKQ